MVHNREVQIWQKLKITLEMIKFEHTIFALPFAFIGALLAGHGLPSAWQIPGMDLGSYLTMDPHLLLGLVNTELRNHCDSLDDLAKTHDLDQEQLEEKLGRAGYVYKAEQNQFR